MSDHAITAIVSILVAITGVAIIATLVSRQSNTAQVLTAGGEGFSGALCTALSPLTGGGGVGGAIGRFLPGSFNPLGCQTSVSSTITFGT